MSLKHIQIDSWKKFPESEAFRASFLDMVLPEYLQKCRWFGAKNAKVQRYNAEVILPLGPPSNPFFLVIIEVMYATAHTENFLLVLGKCNINASFPESAQIATLEEKGKRYLLADGLHDKKFRDFLFEKMASQDTLKHLDGSLEFSRGKVLKKYKEGVSSRILNAEQSNTTLVFDDKFFLKIYRKLFRDPNPDYELTYFLSEQAGFKNCPRFAGSITWNRSNSYQVTIGLMQEKIENQGDAWNYMLGEVKAFYDQLSTQHHSIDSLESFQLYKPVKKEDLGEVFTDLIGKETIERVRKLALRTVEMHLALYKEKFTRRFVPKAFNTDYKAWLLNRLIYHLDHRFYLMESNMHKFKGEALTYAEEFIKHKAEIKDKILNFHTSELNSMRIRIHGDYHLGQVILQGDDFYILDFEGEPEATIRDRKVKQPPMKDVAGMFRSFHYAVYACIFDKDNTCTLSKEDQFAAGEKYYAAIVGLFLEKYLSIAFDQGLDIGYPNEIDFLLRYHILEKGIYELGYEINSRPDWVVIPLKGVLEIIKNEINE